MSDKKSVLLIRAEVNSQIGTGHLMRCIALSQAWARQAPVGDSCVVFAVDEISDEFSNRIEKLGFLIRSMDSSDPAMEIISLNALIKEFQPEWLVLDGYRFDRKFQQAIAMQESKLMVIDDFGHAGIGADVVLNQNISAADVYETTASNSTMLLGTKYSLLRSEFMNFDSECFDQPRRVQRILVTMGGSDPNNVSEKVLNAIGKFAARDMMVDLVIGPCNLYKSQLMDMRHQFGFKIRPHQNVTNMISLMCAADLAVSAGGSTCYELARVGVPMLLIAIAENQVPIAQKMQARDCAIFAGTSKQLTEDQLSSIIKNTCQDQSLRRKLASSCKNLVDGRGAERVVATLRGCTIPEMANANNVGAA